MKKIFITFLTMIISVVCCFANTPDSDMQININQNKLVYSKKSVPIEDELVKSKAFPSIIPVYVKQDSRIEDELIVPYIQSGNTLKIWARKDIERDVDINDELITPNFKSRFGLSILRNYKKIEIEDKFAKNIDVKNARRIRLKNKYDFTKKQVPVQLKIAKMLSTKHKISEGDEIVFKTVKDVQINEEFIPKGTKVIGRIETISASDKMGTPANIIIDNFYLADRPDICLYGNVSKTGANRSIWVYPLYQAGNIMFYVAGFAFVPIHGGHARVLTNDTFTVYYETN